MLLTNTKLYPTLPVTDLARSRKFYEETLGLKVVDETMPGGLVLDTGVNQMFLYERPPAKSEHTLASFMVDNLEQTVDELTKKGVTFEQYDYPELKTDAKGISVRDKVKAAWFKDPDGNILGITEIA